MIIFPGAVIGGALPVDVTLRDTANATTDATNHTFHGMALGAGHTRPIILVGGGSQCRSAPCFIPTLRCLTKKVVENGRGEGEEDKK